MDILIQLVLAAVLAPKDFGVVTMALTVVIFLEVIADLGMQQAVIRRETSKPFSKTELNEIFSVLLLWGSFCYLLLVFGARPIASHLYGNAVLNKIIPILGINLIVKFLTAIPSALLIRELRINVVSKIQIFAFSLGALATVILVYYLNYGVYGLVCFLVLKNLFTIGPLYFYSKWRPRVVSFGLQSLFIVRQGITISITRVLNAVANKVDYIIIGGLLGAASLGQYGLAFLLTVNLKNQVVGILNSVLYPQYAKDKGDMVKLKNLYTDAMYLNSMVIYAVLSLLMFVGVPIINQLYDDKWAEAMEILPVLVAAVSVQMLNSGNQILFRALGFLRLEMKLQVVKSFCFYLPCVAIGGHLYETFGAAMGFLFGSLLSCFLTLITQWRILGIRPAEILSNHFKMILYMSVIFLLTVYPSSLNVITRVLILAISFLLLVYFSKTPLRQSLSLLKRI